MSLTECKKPWLLQLRSSEPFIVFTVSIALFIDVFIYTLIIPIIPKALVARGGIPEQDAQYWVSILLATYGGTLLVGSPLFGYFADHYQSRRGPFAAGLIALGLSTVLFMFARSPPAFIIARGLQGLSAAAVWVLGFSVVVDTVSDDRIGEALGYTTTAMAFGALLGPIIGGFTYEMMGFYGAFSVPIGFIALDIILRTAMIEKSVARRWENHQPVGEQDLESTPARFQKTARPASASSDRNWIDEQSPLLPQAPSSNPLMGKSKPQHLIRLLRSRRIQLSLLATACSATIFAAFETTLPLFVMNDFHWSSGGAGLIFLPLTLPCFTGILVGKIADKFGARVMSIVSCFCAAVAVVCLRYIHDDTTKNRVVLAFLLAIVGLMFTIVEMAAMTEISHVLKSAEYGTSSEKGSIAQAYGLFNMALSGGHLVGPIVGGFIKVHAGWSGMTLVLGLMCAACIAPVGLIGGKQL